MASFRDVRGQAGLTWMQVIDASDTGIGLRSPVPVPKGAAVTLHGSVAGRGRYPTIGQSQIRVAAIAMASAAEPDEQGEFHVGLRVGRNRAA